MSSKQQLTNLHKSTRKSTQCAVKSGIKKFDNFLQYCQDNGDVDIPNIKLYKKLNDIPLSFWNDNVEDVMGYFTSYLTTIADVKAGTASQYLSAVKTTIERQFKHDGDVLFGGRWYTDIRSGMNNVFMDKCAKEGTLILLHINLHNVL
jgi:hypothetical protein